MARITSVPTRDEQLALEPTVPARDLADLRRGADLFNLRRYWDAHEQWEEIWQREQRSIRSFYQGLIQIAAAYHHWAVKQRPNGVRLGITKGLEKLEWYRPAYLGVDVDAMIADAQRMRREAEGRDAGWLASYPRGAFPPFRWLAAAEARA